jgi:DNA-binding PadR family transcriptional regulator
MVENPGLKTLLAFLGQVQRKEPVNFSALSEEGQRGYGMVSRYLRFCLDHGLIRIVSEQKTRGRYPSKTYALSYKGAQLLAIFEDGVE